MAFSGKLILWAGLYAVLDVLFPLVTLFRPCTGIAVALLFILGPRAWPGIALGALVSGLFQGEPWLQLAMHLSVDTLQALLAWRLVRQIVGYPVSLLGTTDLLAFHLLVGPVAMGLGSLLGVAAAQALGLALPYPLPLTLFYSWVGQSFGAVLLSSTVMCLALPDYPWSRRRASVALPVLMLLAMTFYARWLVELRVNALENLTLTRQADQLAKELQRELRACDAVLKATASFFGASQSIDEGEFEQFVSSLVQGAAEPVALTWTPASPSDKPLLYPRGKDRPQVYHLLTRDKPLQDPQNRDTPQAEIASVGEPSTTYYVLSLPTQAPEGRLGAAFALDPLARQALQDSSRPEQTGQVELFVSLPDLPEPVLSTSSREHEGKPRVSQRYDLGGLSWTVTVVKVSPEEPRLGIILGLSMTALLLLSFLRLSTQTARIEMLKQDLESRAEALHELNSELESAVETARRADRVKGQFLANISHEIRTPMNGILGLTRLVLNSDLRPALKEQLRHVELSAQNLLSLFNNLLDLSRMESGGSPLELQPHHLSTLLEETARQLSPQAEAKGVELILSTDALVPEQITVDGLKLRQVFLNLLGNALKFTSSRGEVELSVSALETEKTTARLRFSVRDTGSGIARDQLECIFDPFVQADNKAAAEGSGLGLAICRSLVEQMGGFLEVESLPGVGSTFSFEIDCECEPTARDGHPRQAPVVYLNMRHRRYQAVVKEYLDRWDYPQVEDPTQAEVAIIDGGEILCTLNTGQKAVVTLSVRELGRWFERCREVNAVPLVRPFSGLSLRHALAQALQPAGPDSVRLPARPGARLYRGRRALVVDDNLTNRLLASLLLQRLGFSVDSVEDGEKGLRQIDHQLYDLVLLDLRLPGLDGYQVAQKIRQRGHQMPVIAATAHAQREHTARAEEAGMNDFLTKPLSEERLQEAIIRLIPPSRSWQFEPERLVRAVGDDVESAREVARGFLSEVDGLRVALRQSRQAAELALASHTLKGAVEVFEVETLRQRLEQLERQAENKELREVGPAWDEIEQELDDLVRALQAYLEETK